jgi:hypothetical protein
MNAFNGPLPLPSTAVAGSPARGAADGEGS